MNKTKIFLLAIIGTITTACSSDSGGGSTEPELEILAPVTIAKTNNTKIYAHYMAWFETNESSADSNWGYHWTMANRNPDIVDANGKRQIASHYYPMIGPYHSGDKDVIENHLLMMKYSGIDGILIDWYGTYDLYDYKIIKDNTEQIIALLDKVGLEYAIVYEDRVLTNIVNADKAPSVTAAAKTDMNWLQSHYFNDSNYIKIKDKPLLMDFGPITLTTPDQWATAFSNLNPKPTFLTLWNESGEAGNNASGEFAWVYQNNTHLSNFYMNRLPDLDVAMGGAYPGFHDYYQEGGAGGALGWAIDHNNGATLDATLSLAENSGVDYVQLITWNDFGEGTMIEPTKEFGYSYLQKIKAFAGITSADVFTNISKLYDLRKTHKGDAAIQKKLDQSFYYFVSMQADKAIALIDGIE
ncbi:glycoside hydrolase family 71/99-like protein [Flavobacterium pallidum]|uniref:Glycosyl hydrolase family 99 n=1 Tax=Flavobacterium pallidum TaxID=2172098 RepID=A0A2S1SHW7_9FLAO|nr:glycoside hydrolase family 71/99-like protein [Flavobacterium pallidum]AWI26003.1 hypothetical protein HYN49_08890 [Flavobacterium pallidum]